MGFEGIGASVRRKEDFRFLTGRARYVADLSFPGELHCVVVRSPHAHACIRSIDTSAAEATPGVAAVLTGADMAADDALGDWAARIRTQTWSEAYVFFKHEESGTGPELGRRFTQLWQGSGGNT